MAIAVGLLAHLLHGLHDTVQKRLAERLESISRDGAACVHVVLQALHEDGGLRIATQHFFQLRTHQRAQTFFTLLRPSRMASLPPFCIKHCMP